MAAPTGPTVRRMQLGGELRRLREKAGFTLAEAVDGLSFSLSKLYRVENGYLRSEIIIDPKTYGYLGFRTIVVKDHREPGLLPVKQGQITGWGALMTASFVAKPGSRG